VVGLAQQEADAGPLLWMLLGIGHRRALARWATFFHAHRPGGGLAIGIAVYAISTGDDLPHGLGTVAAPSSPPVRCSPPAPAPPRWSRCGSPRPGPAAFGLLTVALAALTWTTGSLGASVIAGFVVLVLVAYLAIGLQGTPLGRGLARARRHPALLGTISYGLSCRR
jgi:hypothetical protein